MTPAAPVPDRVVTLRPDRITIWPTEAGSYGLDVRWGGPDGFRQANAVRDAGRAGGTPVQLRQDPDSSGWTVRVGPLEREQISRIVETFLI